MDRLRHAMAPSKKKRKELIVAEGDADADMVSLPESSASASSQRSKLSQTSGPVTITILKGPRAGESFVMLRTCACKRCGVKSDEQDNPIRTGPKAEQATVPWFRGKPNSPEGSLCWVCGSTFELGFADEYSTIEDWIAKSSTCLSLKEEFKACTVLFCEKVNSGEIKQRLTKKSIWKAEFQECRDKTIEMFNKKFLQVRVPHVGLTREEFKAEKGFSPKKGTSSVMHRDDDGEMKEHFLVRSMPKGRIMVDNVQETGVEERTDIMDQTNRIRAVQHRKKFDSLADNIDSKTSKVAEDDNSDNDRASLPDDGGEEESPPSEDETSSEDSALAMLTGTKSDKKQEEPKAGKKQHPKAAPSVKSPAASPPKKETSALKALQRKAPPSSSPRSVASGSSKAGSARAEPQKASSRNRSGGMLSKEELKEVAGNPEKAWKKALQGSDEEKRKALESIKWDSIVPKYEDGDHLLWSDKFTELIVPVESVDEYSEAKKTTLQKFEEFYKASRPLAVKLSKRTTVPRQAWDEIMPKIELAGKYVQLLALLVRNAARQVPMWKRSLKHICRWLRPLTQTQVGQRSHCLSSVKWSSSRSRTTCAQKRSMKSGDSSTLKMA